MKPALVGWVKTQRCHAHACAYSNIVRDIWHGMLGLNPTYKGQSLFA